MTYTKIGFINDSLPAIDADNLNHMDDGIENAHLLIEDIYTKYGRTMIGSYVGTGTYGESNPNRLTFSFNPKVVFIQGDGAYGFPWIYGSTYGICYTGGAGTHDTFGSYLTWNDNELSWYGTGDTKQANVSGATYRYIAIG